MPTGDPLAGLRPYQLPEAIPWWPPAPGWWVLLALLLALLAAALWLRRRARHRRAPATLAARELRALANTWRQDGDSAAYLSGLSQVLRRFTLARYPGQPTAGLCGLGWLAFLAAHDDGDAFRNGAGRHLRDSPYQPTSDADPAAVARAVEQWIAHNRRGAQS